MKRLVDVVNFNADASCLSAARWLATLRGGSDSAFCHWLQAFIDCKRRVTLGLIGANVADLATFNPEAIALINAHPEIFELILRPFSHDVGLLRSTEGFALNYSWGERVIRNEFTQVVDYYLPAEFMLTNAQAAQLTQLKARGTFIHPARFAAGVRRRLPQQPYRLTGLFDTTLTCVPTCAPLTEAYLDALHRWENSAWHGAVAQAAQQSVCCWRDGESWLLLPDGLGRERAWLANESLEIERIGVGDLVGATTNAAAAPEHAWTSYPVHSFSEWVREFRMFGFLRRLMDIERRLDTLALAEQVTWLQAANSDILSAVEKDTPVISIHTRPPTEPACEEQDWVIARSDRGFEGEEYLAIVEQYAGSDEIQRYVAKSDKPHIVKLRARIRYCENMPS